MGRNQKRNKKAKIQTGSMNSVAGLKSEQCAGDLNSAQEMGSFATLRNSCSVPYFSLFALLSF